ncbi:MAG: hypothetical protein EOP04_09295 [Proteobacteria bacterium]|nr:MAG: hypothetical protein EOP04_09295 [Pseudomonadota bacterium]
MSSVTSTNRQLKVKNDLILRSLLILFPLTSTGSASIDLQSLPSVEITTGGVTPHFSFENQSVSEEINSLRRISGLTWDHLAKLFNVSRRSLHFWASGRPVNAQNYELLNRMVSAIKAIDCGQASENRARIFRAINGTLPFDLLVANKFEEFGRVLGHLSNATYKRDSGLAVHEQIKRKPSSPIASLDALQDNLQREDTPLRGIKVKRESKS